MSSATITTNTTTTSTTSTATEKPSCFKGRCDIYANENNNQTRFVDSSRLCSLRSGSEQRFYQRRFGGSRSYVLRSNQESYLGDSQEGWEEGWCFESQSSIIPGGPIYRVPGPKQEMRRRFDSARSNSSRFAHANAAAACAASFATHI